VLVIAALIVAAGGLASATAAQAAAGVHAVPSWSMVPLAKDANGDGFIDGDGGVPRRGPLSAQPSGGIVGAGNHVAQPNERLIGGSLSWYLPEAGFPVRLDACASQGQRYRWTVRRIGADPLRTPWAALDRRHCARIITLPEGDADLSLEVRGPSRSDTASVPATVSNLLVLALGDSYASGEGNPRNVAAWIAGAAPFAPYWDEDSCRRSVRGAPAQAALRLERSSPASSVTLLYLACSGATVDQGVLGAQPGQVASQLEQAARILGNRAVDIVIISVGGNDVGFGEILQTCALNANCPLSRASGPPLSAFPTVQDGVQAMTAALPGAFRRLAACLGGPSCSLADGRVVPPILLSPAARVLPTLYPDITRAADGRPCSYFTIPPGDFAWARSTILSPAPPPTYAYRLAGGGVTTLATSQGSLNQQVAATAALPGWAPVTGTWSASGDSPTGHGVCAGEQAWVFGVTTLSGFASASFHPNPMGQSVMADAILAAAVAPPGT
jgi:lysophospholipase L1-like esterase